MTDADELSAALVEMLDGRVPFERCREICEGEDGFSRQTWREIAADGWLEVAANNLDSRLSLVKIVDVALEVGARLIPGPYSTSTLIALPLTERWFPSFRDDIASGSHVVAVPMPTAALCNGTVEFIRPCVSRQQEGVRLDFELNSVPFAQHSTHILVPVQDDEGLPALVLVPLDSPGVAVIPRPTFDLTAPSARVIFSGVHVSDGALACDADVGAEVRRATSRYLLAHTAEALGGIRAVLGQTVAYVSLRSQFGVPIGSFQAVKHGLADVAVSYELGYSFVKDIAAAMDDGADATIDVLMARLHATAAYVRACETAIHYHGGTGFTWEQGLHYWYRAALRHRSSPIPHVALRRLLTQSLVSGPSMPVKPAVAFAVEGERPHQGSVAH
jgi:hypothetical protein